MSKAFQCDICGKFYAARPFGVKYIISEVSKSNDEAEYLDICPYCQKRIATAIDQERVSIQQSINTNALERQKVNHVLYGSALDSYDIDDRR